jgi:Sulfatase
VETAPQGAEPVLTRARAEPASSARGRLVDGAHLLALSGFALAQPLLDLLGDNAEFFAVRGSPARDIVVFALAVTFVPALVLFFVELLAGLVDERLRLGLHLLFVAAFVALIAARAVKKEVTLSTDRTILAVSLAAVLATLAYARFSAIRSVVSVLAVAPAVFLVLFLFFSPVDKLVLPAHAGVRLADVGGRSSVVMIVLDEFPPVSVLNADGRIDPVRYPNFAALARDSTWYRNMTTVDTATEYAVPAIMDGRYPKRSLLPIFADHPQNVFTLLGRKYRLNVWESVTHLCPAKLCRSVTPSQSFAKRMSSLFSDTGVVYLHMLLPDEYEARLPSVTTSWGNFRGGSSASTAGGGASEAGRPAFFERFVASLHDSRRPTLNLVHVLLPHGHWIFLPSCHRYAVTTPVSPGLGLHARWTGDQWPVTQAYQRHLLQVQCTDRLIGDLVRRMRATGIYDRSLLIVTADHGVSIRPGQMRRTVDPKHPTNVGDIAFAPLFVKLPGQHGGSAVDRHVQTIDILPTIADVLGVRIPWHVDGRSLLEQGHPARIHLLTKSGGVVRVPASSLTGARRALLRRQLSVFGAGTTGDALYRIGPHDELIGKRVADLHVVDAPATAHLDGYTAGRLRSLPAHPRVVPTPIPGSLTGPGAARGEDMAVALNGQVAAVTRSFDNYGSIDFQALVPQSAFQAGRNKVEVFWVTAGAGGLTLERLRLAAG